MAPLSIRHTARRGVLFQYPLAAHAGYAYLPQAVDHDRNEAWLAPTRNILFVLTAPPTQMAKRALASGRQANATQQAKAKPTTGEQKHKGEEGRLVSLRSLLLHYAPVRHSAQAQANLSAKRAYLAETLADQLGDRQSLDCYRLLVEKIPPDVLWTTLATVKEQHKIGLIRTRPGAMFVAHIKRYAAAKNIALKFGREAA